ncbi:MAG: hypothetical protein KF862_08995 [Chitinophagaceae bacterium]|nr:hypothetical protein [Chitinophagaceae bacterium]
MAGNTVMKFLLLIVFVLPCNKELFSQSETNIRIKTRLDSVFNLKDVKINFNSSENEITTFQTKIELPENRIKSIVREYNLPSDSFIIEGILSHEYGHILQFQNGMNMKDGTELMLRELHADLMAGFYLSNFYKEAYLKNITSTAEIIKAVCRFFQERNKSHPSIYLIVSMLINSGINYTYNPKYFGGNYTDTIKFMRYAAYWEGLRKSENTSIASVYTSGKGYIDGLIADRNSKTTYRVFVALGLDLINNILNGNYDCKRSVKEVSNKISQMDFLTDKEKQLSQVALAMLGNCCSGSQSTILKLFGFH